jgi:hypothetical protein
MTAWHSLEVDRAIDESICGGKGRNVGSLAVLAEAGPPPFIVQVSES